MRERMKEEAGKDESEEKVNRMKLIYKKERH
jgi:hypothetical protein